jgi:alkyldihydroxyacetonephosphate synthase
MIEGIDKTSLLLTCAVDRPLAELEKQLHREGFTLGYRPVTSGRLTLRQALEKRIPNRDVLLYGGLEDLCVSLQATRKGEALVTRNVPRAATGPDFKKILIGSGSRYARIDKAVLRIHPRPEVREKARVVWTASKDRVDFLKKFWGSGIRPVSFSASGRRASVVLEGSRETVAAERACLHRLVRETKGRIF